MSEKQEHFFTERIESHLQSEERAYSQEKKRANSSKAWRAPSERTNRGAQFDEFKESYLDLVQDSISFAGQGHEFYTEVKANILLDVVSRHLGSTRISVLDVGCGQGFTDSYLSSSFSRLSGVDISAESVNEAALRNPSVHYSDYEGKYLPYEDNTFEVVFTINVMHHVRPLSWKRFVSELHRVTKEGGLVVVFEHNAANPLTRRAVNNCIFDKDAVLLCPKTVTHHFLANKLTPIERRYILFFPFRGRCFRWIERFLSWCSMGAQYYVVARKSSGSQRGIPSVLK